MFRFHTVVVSADQALRATLRRLGAAIGSQVTFVDEGSFLPKGGNLDLLICDLRSQGALQIVKEGKLQRTTPILVLCPQPSVGPHLQVLADERVAGVMVISTGLGPGLDEDELIVTCTKLLRGEILGPQKYLPWGVTTFAAQIRSRDEMFRALEVVDSFAAEAGLRETLRDRIRTVGEALLDNALRYAAGDWGESDGSIPVPIALQYAVSGRQFLLCVRDAFGSLTREQLYAAYALGGHEHGLQRALSQSSKLIFNLEMGHSCEVIALFDRRPLQGQQSAPESTTTALSLHIFVEEKSQDAPFDEPEPGPEPGSGDVQKGKPEPRRGKTVQGVPSNASLQTSMEIAVMKAPVKAARRRMLLTTSVVVLSLASAYLGLTRLRRR